MDNVTNVTNATDGTVEAKKKTLFEWLYQLFAKINSLKYAGTPYGDVGDALMDMAKQIEEVLENTNDETKVDALFKIVPKLDDSVSLLLNATDLTPEQLDEINKNTAEIEAEIEKIKSIDVKKINEALENAGLPKYTDEKISLAMANDKIYAKNDTNIYEIIQENNKVAIKPITAINSEIEEKMANVNWVNDEKGKKEIVAFICADDENKAKLNELLAKREELENLKLENQKQMEKFESEKQALIENTDGNIRINEIKTNNSFIINDEIGNQLSIELINNRTGYMIKFRDGKDGEYTEVTRTKNGVTDFRYLSDKNFQRLFNSPQCEGVLNLLHINMALINELKDDAISNAQWHKLNETGLSSVQTVATKMQRQVETINKNELIRKVEIIPKLGKECEKNYIKLQTNEIAFYIPFTPDGIPMGVYGRRRDEVETKDKEYSVTCFLDANGNGINDNFINANRDEMIELMTIFAQVYPDDINLDAKKIFKIDENEIAEINKMLESKESSVVISNDGRIMNTSENRKEAVKDAEDKGEVSKTSDGSEVTTEKKEKVENKEKNGKTKGEER